MPNVERRLWNAVRRTPYVEPAPRQRPTTERVDVSAPSQSQARAICSCMPAPPILTFSPLSPLSAPEPGCVPVGSPTRRRARLCRAARGRAHAGERGAGARPRLHAARDWLRGRRAKHALLRDAARFLTRWLARSCAVSLSACGLGFEFGSGLDWVCGLAAPNLASAPQAAVRWVRLGGSAGGLDGARRTARWMLVVPDCCCARGAAAASASACGEIATTADGRPQTARARSHGWTDGRVRALGPSGLFSSPRRRSITVCPAPSCPVPSCHALHPRSVLLALDENAHGTQHAYGVGAGRICVLRPSVSSVSSRPADSSLLVLRPASYRPTQAAPPTPGLATLPPAQSQSPIAKWPTVPTP
ncbi:hypothetical protein CERSUDRAFT_98917 [Gelatoporia subvermispora B]|uniref:Uncharacterized protein n=1 Tax=Ceriporiopsis subvermispora (strain B) TaxID=914234 RepID=M2R202_CERS8|nr:hypothetical protein CERSUDRAFT_98917 [Gelatoporia subvermispora B]